VGSAKPLKKYLESLGSRRPRLFDESRVRAHGEANRFSNNLNLDKALAR
jgi:hypothetical protein